MKKLCVLLFVILCHSMMSASSRESKIVSLNGGMTIKGCPLIYDSLDSKTVRKVLEMFQEDIYSLTGVSPKIIASPTLPATDAIVVGTLGQSSIIDSLARSGLIEGEIIAGDPERFLLKTVKSRDGCNLLIVAGSDRRGTAYGVMTLSREFGVDPWVWWGDVPVAYCPALSVETNYISEAPTVRYRGIFINDEDWGMFPWASCGLDKDIRDIGPKTYARVCELLLRLKGNMLAPAMHSCTGAFYSHPESKMVADEYGIMITTSHCEPILFNNASRSEWDSKRDGVWDYALNKDVIYGKFAARLEEAAPYDNIYTIGMRGVHDEAMSSERSTHEKIVILEEVIKDQRELLSSRLGRPAEEIPQIFVPYKETLDLYRAGLQIPDDVIIVWPDDNYGYMKSLSSPEELKRSGGAGVYYHTSYLGTPHDYLWLCTTPPAFMYSELKKAISRGADRYWLLNVGDIKPMELDIQTFFDMAWDFDSFSYDNVNDHQPAMLAGWCGEAYKEDLRAICDEYYRLAWIRKPEYMGWEIEWDSPATRDIRPTELSFSNYRDACKRLADYSSLASKTERMMCTLPDSLHSPFFEMLGYPVLASEMMNRKFLFAQMNEELAAKGDKARANYAAKLSEEACDSIEALTALYNSLEDGKWRGMMTVPPGYVATYHNRPKLIKFPESGENEVNIGINAVRNERGEEGCVTLNLKEFFHVAHSAPSDVRFLDGFGYDGYVLRLGEAGSENEAEAMIELKHIVGDTLRLQIFHLPYFPLYEGQRCRIGVSLDGSDEEVIEYLPEEWSKDWKENVLRNSALSEVSFPLRNEKDSGKDLGTAVSARMLRLRGIDPGMAIQRIVVDYGGFRPGYVGPDL